MLDTNEFMGFLSYRQNSFYCVWLHCASKILFLLKWRSVTTLRQQSHGAIFPTSVYSPHVSVSQFGNSLNISNPSLVKKVKTQWRLRWRLVFFSNKVFVINVYTFFSDIMLLHIDRRQYGTHTFTRLEHPKNLYDLLYCNVWFIAMVEAEPAISLRYLV